MVSNFVLTDLRVLNDIPCDFVAFDGIYLLQLSIVLIFFLQMFFIS